MHYTGFFLLFLLVVAFVLVSNTGSVQALVLVVIASIAVSVTVFVIASVTISRLLCRTRVFSFGLIVEQLPPVKDTVAVC